LNSREKLYDSLLDFIEIYVKLTKLGKFYSTLIKKLLFSV